MLTLEINEKIAKNQGVIHTKLLISHLVIAEAFTMIRLRYDVLAMVRSASCEPGLRINSN